MHALTLHDNNIQLYMHACKNAVSLNSFNFTISKFFWENSSPYTYNMATGTFGQNKNEKLKQNSNNKVLIHPSHLMPHIDPLFHS